MMNRKKYNLSQFTLEELIIMMEIVKQFMDEYEVLSRRLYRYRPLGTREEIIEKIIAMELERRGIPSEPTPYQESGETVERIRAKLRKLAEEERAREIQINMAEENK